MATADFKITRVTPRFHRLVKGLEGALLKFQETDDEDLHERVEAWTAVSVSREALYEYVEYLESKSRRLNKQRTIQLRF